MRADCPYLVGSRAAATQILVDRIRAWFILDAPPDEAKFDHLARLFAQVWKRLEAPPPQAD